MVAAFRLLAFKSKTGPSLDWLRRWMWMQGETNETRDKQYMSGAVVVPKLGV